jgi:hypothetical protein
MNRKYSAFSLMLKYARFLLDFILDVFCIAFFVAFSTKLCMLRLIKFLFLSRYISINASIFKHSILSLVVAMWNFTAASTYFAYYTGGAGRERQNRCQLSRFV